jgi:hypothetical protein
MAEKDDFHSDVAKASKDDDSTEQYRRASVALGADDASTIPKGTIDPVYEAKARVLNRAVSLAAEHYVTPC